MKGIGKLISLKSGNHISMTYGPLGSGYNFLMMLTRNNGTKEVPEFYLTDKGKFIIDKAVTNSATAWEVDEMREAILQEWKEYIEGTGLNWNVI